MSIFVGVASFLLFLMFQAQGIAGGDSGDLVTAASTFGVAHPPGYPLYTLIGNFLVWFIPFYTPAWRVALLSSLPHAITVGIVFALTFALTKRVFSSLIASLILAGNYVFFLYSVTPEVFALHDLLFACVLYFVYRYTRTHRFVYIFACIFVVSLLLSHHHIMAFAIPAFGIALWRYRIRISQALSSPVVRNIVILCMVLGILPYVYVLIAARGNAIVNWDNVTNVRNFIRLITREDYGTFVSGAIYGTQLSQRIIQIKAFFRFLVLDFGILGVLLSCIGALRLVYMKNITGKVLIAAFITTGPLFLFYASFPLFGRFTLATYERFILPSYIVTALSAGVGISYVFDLLTKFGRYGKILKILGFCLICTVTLFRFGSTVWRFSALPQDRTADNLARDVLGPLPQKSIVSLSGDTVLFSSQYMRYSVGFRPDIIVLHQNLLPSAEYRNHVSNVFPDLQNPQSTPAAALNAFFLSNYPYRPVFTNTRTPLPEGWYWVPFGFVFRLYEKDLLPDIETVKNDNARIYSGFQDPSKGILGRYNHLMLSDVLDAYAKPRIEYAKILLKASDTKLARENLLAAIAFKPDSQLSEAYTYLGLTYLFDTKCEEALQSFKSARNAALGEDPDHELYIGITLRDCVKDATAAAEFFSRYNSLKKKAETPL